MLTRTLLTLSLLCFASLPAAAEDKPEPPGLIAARALFDRYVAADANYDARIAEAYALDADICNWRKYPTGETKKLCFPAPSYKALITKAMPVAKARGDTNTYSEVSYTPYRNGYQIIATRFSVLKQYSSPLKLVVEPNARGIWMITREYSVSQP